jgi:hypothetical protein
MITSNQKASIQKKKKEKKSRKMENTLMEWEKYTQSI